MPSRIEDYALIGDCRTAALVGPRRLDRLALHAALRLGRLLRRPAGHPEHGRWLLAPAGAVRATRRRYREGTLVLETEFETDDGTVARHRLHAAGRASGMTSSASSRAGAAGSRCGWSWSSGSTTARSCPGSSIPRTASGRSPGRTRCGCDADVPLRGEGLTTVADFAVGGRAAVSFALTWHPSHEPRAAGRRRGGGDPRHRGLVARLVGPLHLPGRVARGRRPLADHAQGADLRADRRHRRRRHHLAARAARRRARTGTTASAGSATPRSPCSPCSTPATATRPAPGGPGCCGRWPAAPPRRNIMYGLAGERRLTELELDWLPGYEGARPVRIGNAACRQFQLDVYGEVLDAMYQSRKFGLEAEEAGWRLEQALLDFVGEACGTAGRGHLGGARAEAALHPLEGHGLGGDRPGGQVGRGLRPGRPGRRVAAAPRRRSTSRSAARGSTRAWARSSSPTGRRSWTPAC